MRRPLYTLQSQRDLDRILRHVSRDDPAAALRLIERIRRACRRLADSPDLGIRHDEVVEELRIWPVRRYLVFYRPHPAGIEVLRIIHGARDWERLLDDSDSS
ncbi:MAG: type II toxin-antitoxin system RelE/ParE family toxin [Planctomycetaceae bacterium]